ncbi:MAG TPA: hypothetical protein VFU21_33220, partial [Kofleriaceae bacterium]|nr:hypothetical protein [Kofleriaceae bacterium]
EKKSKDKPPVRFAAASSPKPFPTSALPLAAPPAKKVVGAPRPMNRIARPEPAIRATAPDRPITRLEPRTVTAQPVAVRTTPRTVPPKAPPPGKKSRPMPAAAAPPAEPARTPSPEKSGSGVFSPPTPSAPNGAAGKPRPLPRLARGTASPAGDGRPTQSRLALGSGRIPAMPDPSHDVTATDITAVDRARASMRSDDEDTRVNVAAAPSADITLDTTVDAEPEVEATTVDPKPIGVAIVTVEGGASPLPRLTARLRRHSVPN